MPPSPPPTAASRYSLPLVTESRCGAQVVHNGKVAKADMVILGEFRVLAGLIRRQLSSSFEIYRLVHRALLHGFLRCQ